MSVLEKIFEGLEKTYRETAIVSGDESLTYGELWEQSERLGNWIREISRDNRPVIVYGNKSPLMLALFLACAKSGRAYCPVDTSMSEGRLKDIILQVGNPILLAAEDLPYREEISEAFEKEHGVKLRVIGRNELEKTARDYRKDDLREYWLKEDETFYIIFTSGSTGKPKGVEITSGALAAFTDWSKELGTHGSLAEPAPKQGKTYLNQAPFSFDLSVMDVYTTLTGGGRLYCLTKEMQKDMAVLLEKLHEGDINFWVSTPSFADMCLADKSFDQKLMPQLEAFLFCGEKLTKEVAAKLMERFPKAKIINTYGPTESTVALTDIEITKEMLDDEKSLPIGRVKPGSEIKIAHNGELIIGGNTLSKGYFEDEEKTKDVFFEEDGKRYYKTGDKGYYEGDVLYYEGRIDFQIKLHGYRIELGDIENNLLEVEGINNACVLPKKNGEKIRYLVGFVIADRVFEKKEDERAFVKEIKAGLKAKLPDYMVPKKIEFVSSFPLTGNGKMDRKAMEGWI